MIFKIDTAIMRWSVICRRWQDISAGHQPQLGAFLAGWFMRCYGFKRPDEIPTNCKESFLCGWIEADSAMIIEERDNQDGITIPMHIKIF